MTKIKLTIIERLILSNQFLILEELYPNDRVVYAKNREVINSGFELEYSNCFDPIMLEEPLPSVKCKEVKNLLVMWEALIRASKKFGNPINFPGFGGNSEPELLSYIDYLKKDGLFKSVLENDDLNSHCEMLETYQKMYKKWEQCIDKHKLTDVEFNNIKKII